MMKSEAQYKLIRKRDLDNLGSTVCEIVLRFDIYKIKQCSLFTKYVADLICHLKNYSETVPHLYSTT